MSAPLNTSTSPAGPAVVPGVPVGGSTKVATTSSAPTPAVVGGGSAGVDPAISAAVGQVAAAITQLIAAITAREAGGSGVLGGGAGLLVGTEGALGGGIGLGTAAPTSAVIGGGANAGPVLTIEPGGAGTVGGGAGSSIGGGVPLGQMSITPGSPAASLQIAGGNGAGAAAGIQPSGTTAVQPAIVGTFASTGANGAPIAGAQAVSGGGGTPATSNVVDMRYLVGTPQPGGVVDAILRTTQPNVPMAMSEGTWMRLQDAGGATLTVHVHGRYAQDPASIPAALQSGALMAHTHPDGTIHLHDLR